MKHVYALAVIVGATSCFLGLLWVALHLQQPWRLIACGGLTFVAGMVGLRLTEEG